MWLYVHNGQSVGPIEDSALRQLLASGQLLPHTLVWREGMSQWLPATQCGLLGPMGPMSDAVNFASSSEPVSDTTGGLIPYKNPNALAGYYCGVGALIPCFGLILGPVALVLGCKGLSYYKANPIMKGAAHAWVAIVLGSLSSLVNWGCVILGIIGAITSS